MENMNEIKSIVNGIFQKAKIENHPLFEALAGQQLNTEQLHEAGLQIYHVVLHFPRFLSAILTNIPDYKLRMPLVENLFEEHGRLNENFVHSHTYKQFLLGIGLSENDIAQSKPSLAVIAYNRAITDLCLHHRYEEGLSALGVIEEIVARVSPLIGAFAKNEFSGDHTSLFHFTSHETLDVEHANEIYELVSACYTTESKTYILRGLELGMYYHKRLYSDIFDHIS